MIPYYLLQQFQNIFQLAYHLMNQLFGS
jgi:hypothetical protein